jgi:hypothetical protein
LFPERKQLAEKMASTSPLTKNEMWAALWNLHILCLREPNVLYFPGLRPVNGACPDKRCQRRMDR